MSYIGGNTNPGNYIGSHPVIGIASSLSFRNLIINGDMRISQRGDLTGITSTTYGGPDRYQHIIGSAGTFSISQSTDAPDGFSNSIKVACTSATSLGTGNIYLLGQKIEGQNTQHLKFGTSNAKSLTFSFWVKTNVAGDYAVEFISQTAQRQISKSFNISASEASAFDWVQRILTIPGDTVAEIPNNTLAELNFYIWLCAGTNYTSGTLNSSSWNSSTDTNRALAMNLGSSTSNEFYITGVQLEVGTVPTPFEHRPYEMELSLCKRYFQEKILSSRTFGGSQSNHIKWRFDFEHVMRSAPDLIVNATYVGSYAPSGNDLTVWGIGASSVVLPSLLAVSGNKQSFVLYLSVANSGTGNIYELGCSDGPTATNPPSVLATAEL